MQYIVIFNPEWCKWGRKWLYSLESCCHFSEGHHRVKVIYTKYSKLNTMAHTIDCVCRNSILLHSGLNPAWHFWLSTRFSCCLKMKSVENILGYVREQFYRFSRGCKPQENLWDCSRKCRVQASLPQWFFLRYNLNTRVP